MRLISKTIGTMALAALSAAALDRDFAEQILHSARAIERDATAVQLALKSKTVDAGNVKAKIETMGTDVARLTQLVAEVDGSAPQLSERDQADWKLVKDKVTLLGIFHDQKKVLADGDLAKNRGLLRAHAKGVAFRAQKLQETASRLGRSPLS